MRKENFEIVENREVAPEIFKLRLRPCESEIVEVSPGQFVNIEIEGKYLRRPISVCDVQNGEIVLMYRVVGTGTAALATLPPAGSPLALLLPLGNGFDLAASGKRPLLIGGGMGAAPLLYLAKKLLRSGVEPTVILGFGTGSQDYISSEFQKLAVRVATLDGSLGHKGLATDLIPDDPEQLAHYTHFYTCGPAPMMEAACKKIEAVSGGSLLGEVSLEAHMGCGFGACMGCTCKTKYGNKRICKDGPVLKNTEVIW